MGDDSELCDGARSIWVRAFGAGWAAFDLSFMTDPEIYRRMNNIVLLGGFTQGLVSGEWWLAKSRRARRAWFAAMMAVKVLTFLAARCLYADLRAAAASALEPAAATVPVGVDVGGS